MTDDFTKFINKHFKELIILELGLIILSLVIGGLFAVQKVSALESRLDSLNIPDLTPINEAMTKLDKINTFIDELPLEDLKSLPVREMLRRLDEVNAFDRFLGKVESWPERTLYKVVWEDSK